MSLPYEMVPEAESVTMAKSIETKLRLAEALHALMETEPLAKITVSELVAAVGISRKAFYYHFEDKSQLINWYCHYDFVSRQTELLAEGGWMATGSVARYFATDRKFYGTALSDTTTHAFGTYFVRVLSTIIFVTMESAYRLEFGADYAPILKRNADFLAEGGRRALVRWLLDDRESPPEEYMSYVMKSSAAYARCVYSAFPEEERQALLLPVEQPLAPGGEAHDRLQRLLSKMDL